MTMASDDQISFCEPLLLMLTEEGCAKCIAGGGMFVSCRSAGVHRGGTYLQFQIATARN